MNSADKVLTYRQRFKKLTFKQRTDSLVRKFKEILLLTISSTWFKNKLHPWDTIHLDKSETKSSHQPYERIKYSEFKVYKVLLFEVLEIDNFDKYKEILASKFVDNGLKSEWDKEKRRDSLGQIKDSLNSILYGGDLYFIKFNDKSNSDLLESAQLGYIKTLESYFILTIEVTPSSKFREIFQSIIDSDDFVFETVQYHKLSTILKKGSFVSHTNVHGTSISKSIENLMLDLNHQIKVHITDYLKGQFHNRSLLPRIEHYYVDKIEDFEKDNLLKRLIGNFKWSFKLQDNKIHIFVPEFRNENDYCIRILKEKGHGIREQSSSDLTNYDWVESHYLHQSLSLPCALEAILYKNFTEVLKLKRRVYDYIHTSSHGGFLKKIQFLKSSRDYIDLKILLAKNLLLFKRFEEEFNNKTIRAYSDGTKLSNFKRTKLRNKDEQENLENFFQERLSYQISNLNKKISTLEQVFRPIEEVSIYRTNFWLQITSIGIGILAIILTADKAIEILKSFAQWIFSIKF